MDVLGFAWDKFLAQVIVFGAVFLILRRYAFGPILALLEERRRTIAQAEEDAQAMKKHLAEAEAKTKAMLVEASQEAQKVITEAKTSAEALAEQRKQSAVKEAQDLVAKAEEAMTRERNRIMAELKSEVGRLVVDTTSKVIAKELSDDDRRRLETQAAGEVAL